MASFEDGSKYAALRSEAQSTDFALLRKFKSVTSQNVRNGHWRILLHPETVAVAGSDEDVLKLFRSMALLLLLEVEQIVDNCSFDIVYINCGTYDVSRNLIAMKEWLGAAPGRVWKKFVSMHIFYPDGKINKLVAELKSIPSHNSTFELSTSSSVLEMQQKVGPLSALPLSVVKQDDDRNGISYGGKMPPLEESFEPALSCPAIVHRCASFIRQHSVGVDHKGLFRLPGDECLFSMAKARVQSPAHANWAVHFSGEDSPQLPPLVPASASASASTSTSSSTPSCLLLNDIDVVAQLLRVSLRDLPEPVFTFDAYERILQQEDSIESIVQSMPDHHRSTLNFVLELIVDVAVSAINEMSVRSLANIFSASLMRPRVKEGKVPSESAQNSSELDPEFQALPKETKAKAKKYFSFWQSKNSKNRNKQAEEEKAAKEAKEAEQSEKMMQLEFAKIIVGREVLTKLINQRVELAQQLQSAETRINSRGNKGVMNMLNRRGRGSESPRQREPGSSNPNQTKTIN
jgi:hypothetical protein